MQHGPTLQKDFSGFEESKIYIRGAAIWYTPESIPSLEGKLYPCEEYKHRPYVLMDNDPYERFLKGLYLHAVPLSSRLNYNSARVVVDCAGRCAAITDMATTIMDPGKNKGLS